jgi:hypothetical protein
VYFWYYHDASTPDLDNSYTEVNVVIDNVTIINKLTLFRKGTTTGWVQYDVDLTPYINEQCVLVQFESMNKFDASSAQYLAFISITSTPDLAVSSILVSPNISVCSMENKDLSVVVTTTMNQAIDFSITQPDLEVQVGSQTYTHPLRHIMAGNHSDTIPIASGVNLTGITNIKAYLTLPVDGYATNDTANFPIDIRPGLSITARQATTEGNCFATKMPVQQEVTITNSGNVALTGIKLELEVRGDNSTETVTETRTIDLLADSSLTYFFENTYTVPEEATYQVVVRAYVDCYPACNATDGVEECADIHNLSIVSLDNPPSGRKDKIGTTETITISLKNTDDLISFEDIRVTARIENENGEELDRLTGTVPTVGHSSTESFTFRETYTVPNDTVYFIKVYLTRMDNYPEDDTLTTKRYTEENTGIKSINDIKGFTLGQNIPNPAGNSTRIDYTIPEAGEVIFHLHSVSGQLLHSETIEVASGKQNIELNTSSFAAGVYFYSIEYKGQRLVKRMMVE